MPDIHCAAQVFRGPIRFVEWFDKLTSFVFQLVFVRVDHVISIPDCVVDTIESHGAKKIIMVKEADEISSRALKRGVGGSTYAAIFSKSNLESRTDFGELLEQFTGCVLGGAVICHAPFPIGKGLVEQGQSGFGEPLRPRIKRRRDYAENRVPTYGLAMRSELRLEQ